MRYAWFVALLAVAAASARAADKVDTDKLYTHIRETYNIPADVELKLGALKESDVPGFKEAELEFKRGDSKQTDRIYVSSNARFYLMGKFNDLTFHPDKERVSRMDLAKEPLRGAASAKVTVVEYTDFQCPYCKIGYKILRDKMLKDFPKDVKWFYKSFPLKNIHPWAEPAAIAVECANEQGAETFWKMHDGIFDAQSEITARNQDEKFVAIAKASGADAKKFETCYDGQATLAEVRKDAEEAEELGLRSTPSFIVNGHLVSGADYDTLKRVIKESLDGKHGGQ